MSLRDLVIDRARSTPDAVAVVSGGTATTYAELDRLADRFAAALHARGVAPGDRVGVWLEKSARTVAAMQGALRVGAAYVPLDPKSPVARVARIVAGAGMRALVTTAERASLLDGELAVSTLAHVDPEGLPEGAPFRLGRAADDDLAYILYTSGSTGDPKGVCISERNALAFVQWAAEAIGARPDDRLSSHAPFHFDLSVLDLYVAFLVGARVCLVPDGTAYAPARLVQFVVEHAITVWYSVPSALTLMMQHGDLLGTPTPSLRAILFAGEPFGVRHLRALVDSRPGVRFLNLYGPTETNVCTFYEVVDLDPERTQPVPIGRACSGDRVWAETADGRVAEVGEEGELVVEGPTVMKGYWGRPPQQGPYRTGDLVRQLPDGDYEYIGRIDHMVKVRGHRVELGEVEAALLAHPDVTDACVVVVGEGMDAQLVGWLVSSGSPPPGRLAIKRHCAALLPPSMIVGDVRYLPELPRTRNGKIDRRRLRADAAAHQQENRPWPLQTS